MPSIKKKDVEIAYANSPKRGKGPKISGVKGRLSPDESNEAFDLEIARDEIKKLNEKLKDKDKEVKRKYNKNKKVLEVMEPLKEGKVSGEGKAKRKPTAWNAHVASYRKSHPGVSLKNALSEASKTWKK